MAKKQAKRRRKKKQKQFRLPALPVRKIALPVFAAGVVTVCYQFSAALLDQPIRTIMIEGPFQRVTAMQIEEAISEQLSTGFFTANLRRVQRLVVDLPWVDQANVTRRWPGTIEISVSEQVPAAVWGERGLLNTNGELFVTDARHVPAELPRLSGPDEQVSAVATRYLQIREQLIPIGLDVRKLHVDARGAWEMTLQNGIDIRLGRKDVDARTELFLDVAAGIVSSRDSEVEYVDMRYSNGFTIGWKNGDNTAVPDTESLGDGLVAGHRID